MKKSRPKVVVTRRDRAILQFLFEQKVATVAQIIRRYFPNATRDTAHRRIRELYRAGLLSRQGVDYKDRSCPVYSLVPSGLSKILSDCPYSIDRPYLKSDSVVHDLGLVDIRTRLESSELVERFFTENMLQASEDLAIEHGLRECVRNNSDAAIKLKTPKKSLTLAIEYERSTKSPQRWTRKLLDYYHSPEVTGILYICESPQVEKLIRQWDGHIGESFSSKVYTCHENLIHQANKKLAFENREGVTLWLS